MIDRAEKLKNILVELNRDTVSPSDIQKFLELLIKTVSQIRNEFQTISKENLQEVANTLSYISVEHSDILKKIDQKSVYFSTDVQKKIEQLQSLIDDIRANPPKDGEDGLDGINPNPQDVVPLVLKEIPPVIMDTGEQIVDKINELEIEPEKQIDASHIKNFPKEVGKHIIAHSRNLDFFDETTLLVSNPTQIKFTGSGISAALDANGVLVVTVSGGAGNNEAYEDATNTGNNIDFTISNTPVTNTLIVINGNTGQIYMPTTDYSLTGTTITFVNAQAGVTVRARYAYA